MIDREKIFILLKICILTKNSSSTLSIKYDKKEGYRKHNNAKQQKLLVKNCENDNLIKDSYLLNQNFKKVDTAFTFSRYETQISHIQNQVPYVRIFKGIQTTYPPHLNSNQNPFIFPEKGNKVLECVLGQCLYKSKISRDIEKVEAVAAIV